MAETKPQPRRRTINYAFVDSQNLNLGVRRQGWRLDYTRFKSYLQSRWKVTKAFLFIGYIEEQEEMYQHLREMGYTIVFKPTVVHGEEVKGNIDVELVLHVMTEWENYDKAVIISGDGDFFSLVKHLRDKDKFATLIVPNQRQFSSLYKDLPEELIVYMNSLRGQLSYKPKPRPQPETKTAPQE